MSLTKSFHLLLLASSVCRPGDVIADVVRSDGDEPLPPPPTHTHKNDIKTEFIRIYYICVSLHHPLQKHKQHTSE